MFIVDTPVRKWLSTRVSRRIACTHKLNPLKLYPCLVRGTVKATMLHHLTQEGNDTLCAWTQTRPQLIR